MRPTHLFIRDGQPLPGDCADQRAATGYVTTILVPPFHVPAEGIHWGSRAFFFAERRPEEDFYREGLLYAHPTGWEPAGDSVRVLNPTG
jgi:hypothetical protein